MAECSPLVVATFVTSLSCGRVILSLSKRSTPVPAASCQIVALLRRSPPLLLRGVDYAPRPSEELRLVSLGRVPLALFPKGGLIAVRERCLFRLLTGGRPVRDSASIRLIAATRNPSALIYQRRTNRTLRAAAMSQMRTKGLRGRRRSDPDSNWRLGRSAFG